ncbi:unnamed protein product, partial [Vitis vinifera]
MNYLRLSSRLDAVVARLDTQAKMTTISKSMGSIVKSLESTLATGNLQKMSETMDQFEKQFVNMEVQAEFMESVGGAATAGGARGSGQGGEGRRGRSFQEACRAQGQRLIGIEC